MESFKIIKEEKLEKDIKQLFQTEDIVVVELTFGGVIPIIFVKFGSIEVLTNTWKELNSYIAVEYMTLIKDEYSKWNFYIFYLSKESVGKPLKYEIENNKFSSRKIVIENFNSISNEEISTLISEHITNDNIQINTESKQISTFKKNASLAKILDKLSLNKKNDDELKNALNLVEKTYSDEI